MTTYTRYIIVAFGLSGGATLGEVKNGVNDTGLKSHMTRCFGCSSGRSVGVGDASRLQVMNSITAPPLLALQDFDSIEGVISCAFDITKLFFSSMS